VKATVIVTFKTGVLEPQGKAILSSLHSLGHDGVDDVRVGKLIEIDLKNATTVEQANKEVQAMCDELLANPVIENYEIKIT